MNKTISACKTVLDSVEREIGERNSFFKCWNVSFSSLMTPKVALAVAKVFELSHVTRFPQIPVLGSNLNDLKVVVLLSFITLFYLTNSLPTKCIPETNSFPIANFESNAWRNQ